MAKKKVEEAVVETAEVVADKAVEAAEVVEDTAAIEETVKTEETVKEAAPAEEKPAKKTAAKKTTKAAKEPAEKKTATAAKEPTEKKTAKTVLAPQVYIQFQSQEAETAQIVEKIKKQYVSEGHRSSSIKNLQAYVKPEDNAVYYVINQGTKQESVGKVDLF